MLIVDQELAIRMASSTLGHVGKEYPHGLAHVLEGPESIQPSALHPIFYGSFDWHSCVHGWWQLLRLARMFPELAPEIRARADVALTADAAAGELAYLRAHPSFERPYGWGWLLALHDEAGRHDAPWATALQPIATLLAERFCQYLPKLTYPVRTGTHSNTSFALVLAHEWATGHDPSLAANIAVWALDRFGDDRAAANLEPSGEDFLSPTLTEAVLMSRVMPAGEFEEWFGRFLPELPANLMQPVRVSDRSDGRIGHLDGLNLSRAWCWRTLAAVVPSYGEAFGTSADRHLEASLPHLADGYMGEHWLATFALLALV